MCLPGGSLVPALADDEVARIRELDVVAGVGGAEVDVARSLVVLVVVLATDERRRWGELKIRGVEDGLSDGLGGRGGEDASRGGEAEGKSAEGNHCCCCCWIFE